ncbi:MAG: hypothetical protein ACK41T_07495 [Pseudobdellovibrio sp.]
MLTDRIILGESGSDVERGLDSMKYVLSSEYLNSVHSDFLRQDALLSVIFISDEIDQSNEFGNPNSNDFVNFLNQIKPAFLDGTRSWVANYIGILSTQSCDLLGGQVALGTQFLKLVHASQGVSSSICAADLSLAVANIKARLVDQITAYRFLDQPNKSTVQVTIAGRAIHESAVSGWTLETEIGALGQILYVLKFHGDAIPAANEKIDVSYKPAGVS